MDSDSAVAGRPTIGIPGVEVQCLGIAGNRGALGDGIAPPGDPGHGLGTELRIGIELAGDPGSTIAHSTLGIIDGHDTVLEVDTSIGDLRIPLQELRRATPPAGDGRGRQRHGDLGGRRRRGRGRHDREGRLGAGLRRSDGLRAVVGPTGDDEAERGDDEQAAGGEKGHGCDPPWVLQLLRCSPSSIMHLLLVLSIACTRPAPLRLHL